MLHTMDLKKYPHKDKDNWHHRNQNPATKPDYKTKVTNLNIPIQKRIPTTTTTRPQKNKSPGANNPNTSQ